MRLQIDRGTFASISYDCVTREKRLQPHPVYICVCVVGVHNQNTYPTLLYSSFSPAPLLPLLLLSPPLLLLSPPAPSFSDDLHQQLAMEAGLIPLLVHARDNLDSATAARQLELFIGGGYDLDLYCL